MKAIRLFLAGLVSFATLAMSHAASAAPMTYDFYFRFNGNVAGPGTEVFGSFQGNNYGAYVGDITGLTLSYQTVGDPLAAFTGMLFVHNYFSVFSGTPPSGNGVMYFNRDLNNFIVNDCALPCASNQLFLLRQGSGGSDESGLLFVNGSTLAREDFDNLSTWSLTERSTQVAEPGTLALMGLGMVLVMAGRRKRIASN